MARYVDMLSMKQPMKQLGDQLGDQMPKIVAWGWRRPGGRRGGGGGVG